MRPRRDPLHLDKQYTKQMSWAERTVTVTHPHFFGRDRFPPSHHHGSFGGGCGGFVVGALLGFHERDEHYSLLYLY